MLMFKQRLLALLMVLVSIGICSQTWHDVHINGNYYLKAAAFSPVGIVVGIFLIFFPQYSGKPKTTREKVVTFAVFTFGIVLGLCNLYLIDSHMFSFS